MKEIDENQRNLSMDGSVHKELPALFEMAHDRTEEGRIKFVEKLADVFLRPSAALSGHEAHLVNELIDDLLKNASPATRQALIRRFAQAIHAPREVALQIAQAPIEIARPVLSANENLTDPDLIMIVEGKTSDYAASIAMRKQISEAVADALVTTGDIRVMQLVAENLGAKLSGRAIEILVDAARLTSLLQQPIMSRPELNPDSAIRLFWWVSQDLRRVTLERYGFGPGKLDQALGKATDEILSALSLQKEDESAMYHLADWLQERGALNVRILPQLLRMGHYRLFNIALSRLSQLELSLIDLITSASTSRLMVVLCRAIGLDKGTFVSIFLMARGARKDEQIVHPRELSQAMEAFDKLQPDMAKAMIECWRIDPNTIRQRVSESGSVAVSA